MHEYNRNMNMSHRYIKVFDIYSLCLINDRSRVHSELAPSCWPASDCSEEVRLIWHQRSACGREVKQKQKNKSVCEFDRFRFLILKFLFIWKGKHVTPLHLFYLPKLFFCNACAGVGYCKGQKLPLWSFHLFLHCKLNKTLYS